ncbi:oxidoreductase [Actinomadura sp. NBRC 104412]|uniref:aldo/keto reductase n=1 Tax=Actinomadura sp. NBRC 104412 TaxID=3032203 RepID=UPI0024A01C59|nr:aldo/keto reductase [Actinomadura sp. NBRC 104412]GLZ02592.1 oxidoreductase [Actinomadura sp. NBRC 104412]
MDYTHLGRSGLRVSRICLGTDNFGTQTTEDDAHLILDAALDHGINMVDTSDAYGWRFGEGYTEQIIGRWLSKGGGRRERTVLATKLYGEMADWPNNGRLSALHIRRACDASLRRLQTDYIDIYQMHHVDRDTPVEEIWSAMDVLRAQGKIVYVGSSNHAGWHVARLQEEARRRHHPGLVSEQSIYSLLDRTIELEVLPACAEYGVGVLAWAPLSAGLLGGVLEKERRNQLGTPLKGERIAPHRQARLAKLERHRPAIEEYEKLCRDLGADPAHVALSWVLGRPGVDGAIVGPRTLDQLTGALGGLSLHLDADTLTRLDEIFPGPGPAPEAYAW